MMSNQWSLASQSFFFHAIWEGGLSSTAYSLASLVLSEASQGTGKVGSQVTVAFKPRAVPLVGLGLHLAKETYYLPISLPEGITPSPALSICGSPQI